MIGTSYVVNKSNIYEITNMNQLRLKAVFIFSFQQGFHGNSLNNTMQYIVSVAFDEGWFQ